MEIESFQNFHLVGGTSLALQNGHRISIDIDLFGESEIDEFEFAEILNALGNVTVLKKSKNIIIYSINGIKVDFVNYRYPLLDDLKIIDGIRLVSEKDIAAMKLNAISGRGSKKDFIDLYILLDTFSLEQMIGFYKQKYHDGSEFLILKSITYFEDADAEIMPVMLITNSWQEIKKRIKIAAEDYLK